MTRCPSCQKEITYDWRRWSQRIISGNRLLVGDFRDRLVGGDLLVWLKACPEKTLRFSLGYLEPCGE